MLIAHFLSSAASLLAPGGRIHLTLCGNQRYSWHVDHAVANLGLALLGAIPVTTLPPLTLSLTAPLTVSPAAAATAEDAPAKGEGGAAAGGAMGVDAGGAGAAMSVDARAPVAAPKPQWAARARFRNGKLGCKHTLALYGYEHRRTQNDADMRVDKSVLLLLGRACVPALPRRDETAPTDGTDLPTALVNGGATSAACASVTATAPAKASMRCAICSQCFESASELAGHVSLLGSPDTWLTAPLRPPEQKAKDAAAAAPTHACRRCGAAFASRNLLFRHLEDECEPAVRALRLARGGAPRRYLLWISYAGAGFWGSALNNAEHERTHPSVEGTLLEAAARVTAEGASLGLVSACHTERGTHAAANCLVLSVRGGRLVGGGLDGGGLGGGGLGGGGLGGGGPGGGGAGGGGLGGDLDDLNSLALAPPLRLLSPPRLLPGGDLLECVSNVRHAVKRLFFKVVVPYRVFAGAVFSDLPEAESFRGLSYRRGVWLSSASSLDNLPAAVDAAQISALFAEIDVSVLSVNLPSCGGYVEVALSEDEDDSACAARLDGSLWNGVRLLAMPLREAAVRIAAHRRLKALLRRICVGAGDKRRLHNFASDKWHSRNEEQGAQCIVHASSRVQMDLRASDPNAFAERNAGEANAGEANAGETNARETNAGESNLERNGADSGESNLERNGADSGDPPGSSLPPGSNLRWVQTDWAVISLAAKDFVSQQLRRMVGVLMGAICTARTLEGQLAFIDAFFEPGMRPTPLAPPEAIWLDDVLLRASSKPPHERLPSADKAAHLDSSERTKRLACETSGTAWDEFKARASRFAPGVATTSEHA